MAIESIAALTGLSNSLDTEKVSANNPVTSLFMQQMESLSQQDIQLKENIESVLKGDIQNLHQVIIGMEKVQLEFQMAVQVRDRILEGYQQVLRMQV